MQSISFFYKPYFNPGAYEKNIESFVGYAEYEKEDVGNITEFKIRITKPKDIYKEFSLFKENSKWQMDDSSGDADLTFLKMSIIYVIDKHEV